MNLSPDSTPPHWHWWAANRVRNTVKPPSWAGPELAQFWWDKPRAPGLSPRPATMSKAGGHSCVGDRSYAFFVLVLQVMTGPDWIQSWRDISDVTPWWGAPGWGGHKKIQLTPADVIIYYMPSAEAFPLDSLWVFISFFCTYTWTSIPAVF